MLKSFRRNSLLILMTVAGSTVAMAGLFGPNTFEECILDSMKGVTSDQAANAITYACRKKFPHQAEPKKSTRTLTTDELKLVTGRGGPSYSSDYYSINLYNGNSKINITNATIYIRTKIGGKVVENFYANDVDIPPMTTKELLFKFIRGDDKATYEWVVAEAKGS